MSHEQDNDVSSFFFVKTSRLELEKRKEFASSTVQACCVQILRYKDVLSTQG